MEQDFEIFEKILPMMTYEIGTLTYDVNRKLTNKQTIVRTPDSIDIPRQRTQVPVPYTLSLSLYLTTKNLNDGWQVIEQILPFFQPAYTVRVRHFPVDSSPETPEPTNEYDMPFLLQSLTWTDDWQGDVAERRIIEWQLEFETKLWFYGPVSDVNIILDSRAIVSTPPKGGSIYDLYRSPNSPQEGTEVGWVNLHPDSDTPVYANDSDMSPAIINIFDSDGNLTKIRRVIDSL